MKLLPRSLSLRLMVALSVISFLVFAATGTLLHHTLQRELAQAAHDELRGKVEVVRHFVEETRSTRDVVALRHHLEDMLIGHRELRVWMHSEDDSVSFGGTPAQVIKKYNEPGHLRVLSPDGVPMDALDITLDAMPPLPALALRVALDVRPRDRLLDSYRNAVIAVCVLGVLLSVGLSALATWHDLAPIKRLSSEATRIGPYSMSLRLAAHDVDREVRGLVDTFNTVLDRLEGAYRQMESFNADVAHELRTPLATLISGTQLVLSNGASPDDLRETLVSNLEDLEQLKRLINDMLFLARADQGDLAQALESTDLAVEADKMIEYCEPLLAEARVVALREGSARAVCNATLMRRAIVNLLSNAIKHTNPGQAIVVRVESAYGLVRISIVNPGVPISQEIAERMFDRFFRADPARARVGESHGLGLAIVKAIATMHRGKVFVETDSGRNHVGLEVPEASGPVERRTHVRSTGNDKVSSRGDART